MKLWISSHRNKESSKNKGFTLVELIVVIVIILILSAVLVPSLLKYVDRSQRAVCAENKHTLYIQIMASYADGTQPNLQTAFDALPDNEKKACPSGGKYTIKVADDGYSGEIICSKHDGNGGGGSDDGDGGSTGGGSTGGGDTPPVVSDGSVTLQDKENNPHNLKPTGNWDEERNKLTDPKRPPLSRVLTDATGTYVYYASDSGLTDQTLADSTLQQAAEKWPQRFMKLEENQYVFTEADIDRTGWPKWKDYPKGLPAKSIYYCNGEYYVAGRDDQNTFVNDGSWISLGQKSSQ